jgi:CRISPR-associated protein Cas1
MRRGPLAARRQPPAELPEYFPARMVNEFVYCPRLFFYEWVEQVFAHSPDTLEGAFRHEKLERKTDELPPAAETEDGGRIHSRSVQLASEAHKLIATIDLIEGEGTRVTPVDYKRGRPRDGADGPEAWDADQVQVAVQVLVLRDNGYTADEGVLYYNETKQRVRVVVDDALVERTLDAVEAARVVARGGRIPPPLADSPKCPRCSLVSICLPDETMAVMRLRAEAGANDQLSLFPVEAPSVTLPDEDERVRRLVPARDDLRPLYIAGHGLTVGKSGEVLQVRDRDRTKAVQEVRLSAISQVNVYGNAQLTASAVQGLCWAEKPIGHFSYSGWFYGLTQGLGLKNVFLRRDQFRRADESRFCLRTARQIVGSKIRNQRTLLQRNHVEPPAVVLRRLKELAGDAGDAHTLGELLGIEGTAAKLYFGEFNGMLKAEDDGGGSLPRLELSNRNRRPPRDPLNALLSFAYSLLVKDLTIVCHAVGFDPFIGFFHQPRFGRPALALDLMEAFRPLVADSAVITAVNTRMVTAADFIRAGDAVAMTPGGRKSLIRAYEQRMDTLVTHPLFGYRVNYRRVLEIQTRLLARAVSGEIDTYPTFETR